MHFFIYFNLIIYFLKYNYKRDMCLIIFIIISVGVSAFVFANSYARLRRQAGIAPVTRLPGENINLNLKNKYSTDSFEIEFFIEKVHEKPTLSYIFRRVKIDDLISEFLHSTSFLFYFAATFIHLYRYICTIFSGIYRYKKSIDNNKQLRIFLFEM